jgi:heme oxygenase (biliverdin-IX-beta and delta-forming)
MASTLRASLKEATASAHSELEATPIMRAFASGLPSAANYCEYLARQWQLHVPLEDALRAWLPADWSALRLRKAQWLHDDLRALGTVPEDRPAKVPHVGSWAQALGVLYVMEGGTLGLQVLGKRLSEDHPALGAAGRFMHGYGAETGRHWRAFIGTLDTLPANEWHAAAQAADATFLSFIRHFSQARP